MSRDILQQPFRRRDPRQVLAQQLITQGTSTSPIQSPYQGLARLAQAAAGSFIQSRGEEDQKDKMRKLAEALSGGSPVADPGVGGEARGVASGIANTPPTSRQIAQRLIEGGNPEAGIQFLMQDAKSRAAAADKTAGREADFQAKKRFATDPDVIKSKLALKRAGRPITNVNVAGAKSRTKFAEIVGSNAAQSFSSIVKDGRRARSVLAQLKTASAALNSIRTGVGTDLRVNAARYAKALGIDPKIFGSSIKEISSVDQFRSVANQITTEYTKTLKGALSEKELLFLQGIVPRLSNTAEGNNLIIEFLAKANEQASKRAQFASQVAKTQPTGADFFAAMEKFDADNPVFSEADQAKAQALSAPVADAPSPVTPSSELTDEELKRRLGIQ